MNYKFLEPVYLNEKMLLNCASYMLDGITLNSQTTIKSSSEDTTELKGSGKIGFSGLLQSLLNINAEFEGKNANKNIDDSSINSVKTFTLGSIHMQTLEKLKKESLIQEFTFNNNLNSPYVYIPASLKPFQFYDLIQVLKIITPQCESIYNTINRKKINNKNQTTKKTTDNINPEQVISIIKTLTDALEKDYIESSILEMLLFQNENCIGIVDIELDKEELNKVKSQLNDGNFIIIGKITKIIGKNERLNLLQRSFISPLLDIIGKLTSLLGLLKLDSSYSNVTKQIESMLEYFNKVTNIFIDGPALRIKAMSICI